MQPHRDIQSLDGGEAGRPPRSDRTSTRRWPGQGGHDDTDPSSAAERCGSPDPAPARSPRRPDLHPTLRPQRTSFLPVRRGDRRARRRRREHGRRSPRASVFEHGDGLSVNASPRRPYVQRPRSQDRARMVAFAHQRSSRPAPTSGCAMLPHDAPRRASTSRSPGGWTRRHLEHHVQAAVVGALERDRRDVAASTARRR